MNETIYFTVPIMLDGKIIDEGTVYGKMGRYYIQYVGLGETRRISKERFERLKAEVIDKHIKGVNK